MATNRIFNAERSNVVGSYTQQASPNAATGWLAVVVPVSSEQVTFQQQLYRLAYQRAREALAPPRHYRQMFSVWN